MQSAIVRGEGNDDAEMGSGSGGAGAGGGGGGDADEFGVDPNLDPELAMVSFSFLTSSCRGFDHTGFVCL